MTLKQLVTSWKLYAFLLASILLITAKVLGFAELPKKVTDNTASIGTLAKTFDSFIMEQRVYRAEEKVKEESRDKREELMLKLIIK